MIRSRYSPSFYIFSIVLLGIIALVIDAVVHAWAPILPLAVSPAIILFIYARSISGQKDIAPMAWGTAIGRRWE